tara:strand:+ start:1208 stop:1993 length:786 start_codon:yes stop_codon:yes gene_type:complete
MKKLIKKIINKFGFDLIKINPKIKQYNSHFKELLKDKIRKNPVIFDVGANKGQSIESFLKLFDQPIIHSFEPVEIDFNNISKKFENNKNIFLNNVALGHQTEEKEFNITAGTWNSSFNKINSGDNWLKARAKELKATELGPKEKDFHITSVQKVNIITLDNYCKDNNINQIDLLKIDTQGYEDKVLEGSLKTIKDNKIKVIMTEVSFDDIYDKYFSFSDIEKFIVPHDFRMVGIRLTSDNLFSGPGFSCDAYYFNKNYYNI